MAHSAKVEIDNLGRVHPLDPTEIIPAGPAILTWPTTPDREPYLLSENSLADWLDPEEDAAWAHLQPDK